MRREDAHSNRISRSFLVYGNGSRRSTRRVEVLHPNGTPEDEKPDRDGLSRRFVDADKAGHPPLGYPGWHRSHQIYIRLRLTSIRSRATLKARYQHLVAIANSRFFPPAQNPSFGLPSGFQIEPGACLRNFPTNFADIRCNPVPAAALGASSRFISTLQRYSSCCNAKPRPLGGFFLEKKPSCTAPEVPPINRRTALECRGGPKNL